MAQPDRDTLKSVKPSRPTMANCSSSAGYLICYKVEDHWPMRGRHFPMINAAFRASKPGKYSQALDKNKELPSDEPKGLFAGKAVQAQHIREVPADSGCKRLLSEQVT